MRMLRKLRWQLMLSYLPLILVPVLLVGLVTRVVAEQGLTLLVSQGAMQQARLLSDCFATYYDTRGSWDGLTALLQTPASPDHVSELRFWLQNCNLTPEMSSQAPPSRMFIPLLGNLPTQGHSDDQPPAQAGGSRTVPGIVYSLRDIFRPGEILVADPHGTVVASNKDANIGRTVPENALSYGAPIIVRGQQVGTLVVGTTLSVLDQQQRESLNAVNRALILSGAVSVVLAIALGWGLSGQITTPMRQLMAGVRRLSTGAWSAPLEVRSENEFGDLTRAFNTMASEVTHQQQLNRQMVADIAHDLRTPLSAMSLELEAIEAGFQTPADATVSLREEITWLQRLVEDLRLLSLMDADQIQLQTEKTPLTPFLCGILDFWQTMANEENRCLTLNAPDSLPEAELDPHRMRQVLGNLIDNAIRHTRPGGNIELAAQVNANGVTFRVSDDGEGIAPEDLPHVFDRFYRADPARRRSDSGSGLGLSISRRLVEMHGGTITVKSAPGQGTTFTITLPQRAPGTKEAPKEPRRRIHRSEKQTSPAT